MPTLEVLETGRGELLQPPDLAAFRAWNRDNKSMALEDKLMTEKEAVGKFVASGDYIGFELYGTCRAPLNVVREIVRQAPKDLRLVGQGLQDVDFLVAAGLVKAMDLTYVGYEVHGLSPVLRRAAEKKGLQLVEWSNAAIAWRFKRPYISSATDIRSRLLRTVRTSRSSSVAGRIAPCSRLSRCCCKRDCFSGSRGY